MENVELLAPAGDLEKLKIAYLYGADAVYCSGKKFGLRANANNFTLEELDTACKYAHSLNKKIYVTVNIIFHNAELEGLEDYLRELDKIGIDAIIASDILVIKKAQELNLNLEVHVSTQSSILNSNAMCTSFSGRCVLSNYCTNRDANRGGCAQICRWTFELDNIKEVFSMTPKDLNLIQYISNMINAGVNSFKVEGRMRGIYYIATVILVYRRIIDKIKMHNLSEGEIF